MMKLSARNQIKGRVTEVIRGQTTGHVHIDIGNGVTRPLLHHQRSHRRPGPEGRRRRLRRHQGIRRHGGQVAVRPAPPARSLLAGLAMLALLAPFAGAAQPAPALAITGRLEHPATLGLRLVVPGDKRPGRSVRDLVSITVN